MDELPGRSFAAVQVDGRHKRLEDVGHQAAGNVRMRGHPLAQDQKLIQPQQTADLRARLPADDHRLDLGEIAFQVFGILPEEDLADDQAQNGVAQELQALVGGQAMQGARGVREGRTQQLLVLEHIAESFLTAGQQRFRSLNGCWLCAGRHEAGSRRGSEF